MTDGEEMSPKVIRYPSSNRSGNQETENYVSDHCSPLHNEDVRDRSSAFLGVKPMEQLPSSLIDIS